MTQATYQIRLKDQAGAQIAVFSGAGRGMGGLRSFLYNKRVRTPGAFMLQLDGRDERVALFTLDYQVEFWRHDAQAGLGWYLDFAGFYRSPEHSQDDEGQDTFTARGAGYNCLLAAENIRWPAGSAQARKNAPAETATKEFVDENIGPGATAPPRSRAGVMPGLTVEADGMTGATWRGARMGKNLLDVLMELADYGPGDFMIIGTGPATFEFKWRHLRWGLDKTRGNTDGNAPMVFAARLGNATNMRYNYSRLDEVNVVDVLGPGAGTARSVVSRTSGAEIDSPWNVRAVSRDARDTQAFTALQARGDKTLSEQRSKQTLTFNSRQTVATRYGRDWDIGDLVTVEYTAAGVSVDQKIVGASVTVASDGTETIAPEMESEN